MNKAERNHILRTLLFPAIFVAICWIVWLFDSNENLQLFQFGIHPRSFSGLRGVLFAPFIHDTSNVSHLLNNTTPFLFLGWALFYFYREVAFKVLFGVWLLGGFWVWLIGRADSYHAGASGVLYGLASFLFFSGLLRRQMNLMGLTLLVSFLYGGMIWGIFPYDIRISWESHLTGGIAGIIFAVYFRKSGLQRPRYEWEDEKVVESFSELNHRHEEVMEGKIPDPNMTEEAPPFTIHYQFKPHDKSGE